MSGQATRRSDGSSPSRKRERTLFSAALREIRKHHGIQQNELAKELGISRTYLNVLEGNYAETKQPSLELLAKLAHRFPNGPDILRLVFSALTDAARRKQLNADPAKALALQGYIGGPTAEAELQRQDHVKSIWIISNEFGESSTLPSVADNFKQTTLNNLDNRNVSYTYFVPTEAHRASLLADLGWKNQTEWDLMIVLAPSLICVPRIRIINPMLADEEGVISLGPIDQVGFWRLEPTQVGQIVSRMHPIRNALAKDPKFLSTEDGKFVRLFWSRANLEKRAKKAGRKQS